MPTNSPFAPAPKIERLAYREHEAAQAIGISDRTLWALEKAGKIRCARIGRAKVYSLESIQEFLRTAEAAQEVKP